MSGSIKEVDFRPPILFIEQWKARVFLAGNNTDREDFRHFLDTTAGDKPLDKAEWLLCRYGADRVIISPVCPSLVKPVPDWEEIEKKLTFQVA